MLVFLSFLHYTIQNASYKLLIKIEKNASFKYALLALKLKYSDKAANTHILSTSTNVNAYTEHFYMQDDLHFHLVITGILNV